METKQVGIIIETQTLKNELSSYLWLMNINNIEGLKNNKSKRIIFGI